MIPANSDNNNLYYQFNIEMLFMSLERVIKALVDLGLSIPDAEVYVYLTKNGPLGAIDLTEKLNLNSKQLKFSLKNLQEMALIKTTSKFSVEFAAISFEKALDMLIEIGREQTKTLHEIKKELLSNWKKSAKNTSEYN